MPVGELGDPRGEVVVDVIGVLSNPLAHVVEDESGAVGVGGGEDQNSAGVEHGACGFEHGAGLLDVLDELSGDHDVVSVSDDAGEVRVGNASQADVVSLRTQDGHAILVDVECHAR